MSGHICLGRGVPVLPIGAFGGSAHEVWKYMARDTRLREESNADTLAYWNSSSASICAKTLRTWHDRVVRKREDYAKARRSAYVALSRHRESAQVFYSAEDFEPPWGRQALSAQQARSRLFDVLSRARPKELAHDFLDRDVPETRFSMDAIETLQQESADRWRGQQTHERTTDPGLDLGRGAGLARTSRSRGPEEELDL